MLYTPISVPSVAGPYLRRGRLRALALGATAGMVVAGLATAAPAEAAPAATVGVAADVGAVAGQTVPVPVALDGFPSSGDLVAVVTVPPGGGTLGVTPSGGLALEHGYPSFTGQSALGLRGTAAEVEDALATLTWSAPASGDAALQVEVTEAPAGVYFDAGTGHYYQVSAGVDDTWSDARDDAQSRSLFGLTGYLATITSAEENDFIAEHTPAANAWIGASDAAVEGEWRWVTGPEAGTQFWQGAVAGSPVGGQFVSWAANEPNNWQYMGREEDYAGTNFGSAGQWNDFLGNPDHDPSVVTSTLVEFGGMPAETGTAASAGATAQLHVATAPGAPASVTTAPGDGEVRVDWTPPASDGHLPVTGYTVTASPGGASCTWTTGPLRCTVTGLTNGTAYTFAVVATNAAGTGGSGVATASPAAPVVPAPVVPAPPAPAPPVLPDPGTADLRTVAEPATEPAAVAAPAAGTGTLASTGAEIAWPLGLGALAVLAGGVLLVAGRTRRRAAQ